MPDGDNIHAKPYGKFCKPFRQICDENVDIEVCSDSVVLALKKQIQDSGDICLVIIKEIATVIDNNQTMIFNRQNYRISNLLRKALIKYQLSTRLRETIFKIAKIVIHKYLYKTVKDFSILQKELLHAYMIELYKSLFRDITIATSQSQENINSDLLRKRVEEIYPEVEEAFSKWVKKIESEGTFSKIRKPNKRLRKKEPVEVSESIFSL